MSYSRWSNSFWYTYWTGPVDRDEAQFEICGVKSFTAKQMRENIDACLAAVNKVDFDPRQPTTSEMAELRGYMQDFLREVDVRCPVKAKSTCPICGTEMCEGMVLYACESCGRDCCSECSDTCGEKNPVCEECLARGYEDGYLQSRDE